MGRQAHRHQLDMTLSDVAIGRGQGAELVTGGARVDRDGLADGYFVEPTVFAGVSAAMRIAQEEIFGPVAALIPFDGEEEAIAIASSRSEEHTSELQSLMRTSYAVFCLKKKKNRDNTY